MIVSAEAEWTALVDIIGPKVTQIKKTPYGDFFVAEGLSPGLQGKKIIFFHGGWGKIDSAASAQWAISVWQPQQIINIGTAGGFPGRVFEGEIVYADNTVVYDIIERMGDSQTAIKAYSTKLGPIPTELGSQMRGGTILSADQDIDPEHVDNIMKSYNALAADWESGSIARICKKNNTKIHILRGISDVVYPSGSRAYGKIADYHAQTRKIMEKLVVLLSKLL